ncbi:MAG: thermonuclease family protein [Alphaproteobacteria bacterium]|nr:thermonuclease family protein [Alphaproteobacteria bacterium]
MTKRILFLCVFISSLFPFLVRAEGGNTADVFPDLRLASTTHVERAIAPTILELKDERFVYLTGLDFPDYNAYDPGPLAVEALDALKEAFEGKKVRFYQTRDRDRGRTNRMGHELGHIERADDGLWAQGMLLEKGLARVRTSPRNPEMAAAMLVLEAKAREAGAGLWADGDYALLTPETALDARPGFQIVEGTVRSVAIVRNRIFLNFGADWKTDFTVAIEAGDRRAFSRSGLDPLQWNGRRLRIRGWLEEWNGPCIKADHPGQFEFPDTPAPASDTSAP